MKTRIIASFLSLVASALSSFAASGTAIPGGNQAVPYVITKPGAYYLAANRVMTDGAKNAIEITASDVTLDLNGNVVGFAPGTEGSGDGIHSENAQNVEISNGTISNPARYGIFINQGDGVRILNVRIVGAGAGDGIVCFAPGTVVDGCYLYLINGQGIHCTSADAVIRRTHARYISGGVAFMVGPNASVMGNTVDHCEGSGIVADANSTVQDNQITFANLAHVTTHAAIRVAESCTVRGNSITKSFNGIIVNSSPAFVEENTLVSSGPNGNALISSGGLNSIYRNNRINWPSGAVTQGFWKDGGGNIQP